MLQVTIRDFFNGKADDLGEDYGIYIFRNGDDIFYVGRSVDPVNRVHQHIENWTSSYIGDIVNQNLPASLSWQIDFLTHEECRPFVQEFYKPYRDDVTRSFDLDVAERCTIRHYGPCANISNNVNPHRFPAYVKRTTATTNIEVGVTDNLC